MNLLLENDPTYKKTKKGSLIFKEGDTISDVLLIKKGRVLLFATNEAKIIPLAILNEKDSLGEEFFANDIYTIYAYALEDCEFVSIPVEKIKKYLEEEAQWVGAILQKVSSKLSVTREVFVEHKVVDDELVPDLNFDEEFEVHLRKLIKDE